MKPQPIKTVYNPKDFYLVINTETEKIFETFRIKSAATKFIHEHPYKDILKLELNKKYIK